MQQPLQPQTKVLLRKLAIVLITGIIVCSALHTLAHTLPNTDDNRWIIDMFDLDTERNVPTWYASILWFLVAITAICSCYAEKALRKRAANAHGERHITTISGIGWLIIGAIFTLASADETATIHEEIGSHLQQWHSQTAVGQVVSLGQHLQSSPNSPWIVFYAPGLIMLVALAAVFLWQRLSQYRLFLILCFLCLDCFLCSVAADHYQGLVWNQRESIARSIGLDAVTATKLSITIEETLENLGCTFLILAFAGYACDVALRGRIAASPGTDAATPQASSSTVGTMDEG